MRILQVVRTLDPAWGGQVEAVRILSEAAIEQGLQVEVVCLDEPNAPWLPAWRLPVHTVGTGFLTYGYSRALAKWLMQNTPAFDALVVHGIWMYFSCAARLAALRSGVPYYVFVHGALDPWFREKYPIKHLKKILYWCAIEHKVLRDARSVLFTTEEERILAHNAFRPYKCDPSIVAFGITSPPSAVTSQVEKEVLVQQLTRICPSLNSRSYILFLGRIHEKKGVDLLIEAFSIVKDQHPGTAIVIAGPGDETYVEQLKKSAIAVGVADRIVWTGPLYGEAKWTAIRGADVFALPSHQENFGISVVESLACGTPVLISNRVNIWREVMQHHAGFVGSDDVGGTTSCLIKWGALSRAEKRAMSTNSIGCFQRQFDMSLNFLRFAAMLRKGQAEASGSTSFRQIHSRR